MPFKPASVAFIVGLSCCPAARIVLQVVVGPKNTKWGIPPYPIHTLLAINAIDASFISIEVSQVRACTSIYKASTQRSISDSDDRLCVLASAIECLYSYGSIVLVYICNFRETERDCIAFQHIEPQDSKDKYSVETRTVRS